MRREKKLKPMNTDLETAKLLESIFGYKILKDIKITIKKDGGDKQSDGRE